MAGMDTRNAILKAVGSSNTSGSSENSATIQRMLDNLKNDTSLRLSADKKAAMLVAVRGF